MTIRLIATAAAAALASSVLAFSGPAVARDARHAFSSKPHVRHGGHAGIDPRLSVPPGFHVDVVATLSSNARELAVDGAGNLIAGTSSSQVFVVPGVESPAGGSTPIAVSLPESPAAGVSLGANALYVGTNTAVWKLPYSSARGVTGTPTKIFAVRTGPIAPGSDGDVHVTTSVALDHGFVIVAVGSSCNACAEVDPTRAAVMRVGLNGGASTSLARRVRNAIAIAVNPANGIAWIGGAGQDSLPLGHPYEYLDPVLSHPAGTDYGWPVCEENHQTYGSGANCSHTVIPRVEFPAYQTIIGATFYPQKPSGAYAFPAAYRGGMFVSMHGSWHSHNGIPIAPPRVSFVPMTAAGQPQTQVDWSNPTTQWSDFFKGWQRPDGWRIDRPTGVAVGPLGSLFVGTESGTIYRIRPN